MEMISYKPESRSKKDQFIAAFMKSANDICDYITGREAAPDFETLV